MHPKAFPSIAVLVATTLLAGSAAASGPVAALPMKEERAGTFYIRATLGADVETDLLVDTGSGYVSLSRRTFERLEQEGGTTHLRDVRGALADGTRVTARIYHIRRLALGGGCVIDDLEIAVLPGADRDILGLSALRRVAPFTMRLDPPVLQVSNCARRLDGPLARTAS